METEKPKLTLFERIERAYLIRKDEAAEAERQWRVENLQCPRPSDAGSGYINLCGRYELDGTCESKQAYKWCLSAKEERARERREHLGIARRGAM